MYERMAAICESITRRPLDQGDDPDRRRRQGLRLGEPTSRNSAPSRLRRTRSTMRRGSIACWARWSRSECRPLRRLPEPAPAAGRGSPPAATCGSARPRPGSAFRSRARLGNCLSMSNISRLTSLIGPARTKDLIFTARLIEAAGSAGARAASTKSCPTSQRCSRRADETAKLVASHAPITLEVTKEAVAPHPADVVARRGRGPDPSRLYERGFPRGNGRFPQQAHT